MIKTKQAKDSKNKLGISTNKLSGVKFPSKKVKSKELGDLSFELSKEEEIMRSTPGLMENSIIESISTMNSIFQQKQSERLMLNDMNKITTSTNNNESMNDYFPNSMNSDTCQNIIISNIEPDNPLDNAVIIKDSSEIEEEERKEKQKENSKESNEEKADNKKENNNTRLKLVIFGLISVIIFLITALVLLYFFFVRKK